VSVKDPENERRLAKITGRVKTHVGNLESCSGSSTILVKIVIKRGLVTDDSEIVAPEKVL